MGLDTIADWQEGSAGKDLGRSFHPDPSPRQSGALMSFGYASLIMANQKVTTTTRWEDTAKQLEVWGVVCAVFLGNVSVRPGKYKVLGFLEEANEVGARLQT